MLLRYVSVSSFFSPFLSSSFLLTSSYSDWLFPLERRTARCGKVAWPPGPTNICALRVAVMPVLEEDLEMGAVELIGGSNDWEGWPALCSQ